LLTIFPVALAADAKEAQRKEKKRMKDAKKKEKDKKVREKTGREHWTKKDWAAHNESLAIGKHPFDAGGTAPSRTFSVARLAHNLPSLLHVLLTTQPLPQKPM